MGFEGRNERNHHTSIWLRTEPSCPQHYMEATSTYTFPIAPFPYSIHVPIHIINSNKHVTNCFFIRPVCVTGYEHGLYIYIFKLTKYILDVETFTTRAKHAADKPFFFKTKNV